MNNTIADRVAQRNEVQPFLEHLDAIVATAVRLLESDAWAEIAAGLAVLTGRRCSEILATAQFQPHPNNRWSVIFTGALKRRGETQVLSFEIPTLTTAERVIQALATVRATVQAENLSVSTINVKYSKPVAQA